MNTFEKSQAIMNQELQATENLENFASVIEKENPSINAFLEVDVESALSQAKSIDEKIKNGEKLGSLAGLVFGIKANISVEDRIISGAAKTLENYYGSFDAYVIKRIKEEDGIIIGMCNMDEFAAGNSTETSYFGPTDNPAALGHIPGGSSGGSAAAIASGMCDISLGSDTGGSIRNPASHCGIFGFKPTYGFVSRQGLLDLSMSLDQIGPMASDTSGIAMALDAIVGYDETDCTSLNQEFPVFTDIATEKDEKLLDDMKDMKVATITQFKDVTDDHINNVIDDSVDKIQDMGAEVVELSFDSIDFCIPTYYLISCVEFFSGTRKYDGRKYGYKIQDVCGEEVLRRMEIGSYISKQEFSGKYYKKALQARSLIKKDFNKLLNDVDLIIGPTVPKLPHKIGEKLDPLEMYAYDILTSIANLAGIPAGSMKAGEYNGIPIGLQLQAKANDDTKIIKAMAALESLDS